jgi:hypothetical protein
MKKPTMLRVLVTTALMAAFALAPWPTFGQSTAIAPSDEHLKVENGDIWIRNPGQPYAAVGPATVGNAVKALRKLYVNATFAVDPRVAELPLTDLVVRANEPITDLAALRTACGGRFNLGVEPNSLYTLQRNNSTDLDPSKKEDRNIECFNLTGYLGRIITPEDEKNQQTDEAKAQAKDKRAQQTREAVDQLKSIIADTIKDFDATIGEPHFQFYGQAQLLIVTGSHRAIEIAAKVIHALPGQPAFFGKSDESGNFRNNFSRDSQSLEQVQSGYSGGPIWIMPDTVNQTTTQVPPVGAIIRKE